MVIVVAMVAEAFGSFRWAEASEVEALAEVVLVAEASVAEALAEEALARAGN